MNTSRASRKKAAAVLIACTLLAFTAELIRPAEGVSLAVPTFSITAKSAILVDAQTSRVVYSKAPNYKRTAASTVKLLTALVVLDRLSLNHVVKGTRRAAARQRTKIDLRPGEPFYVRDLLKALLIASANDAATALAEAVAGSDAAFADLMNEKARQIGARNSHFVNPHGLPCEGQYSTAHDLAKIVQAASRYSFLIDVMRTRHTTIQSLDGRVISLRNHNKMLWKDSRHLIGKTGWTRKSRHCFAGRVDHSGRRFLVVMLGSVQPWADLKHLLDICYGVFAGSVVRANRKIPSQKAVLNVQRGLRRLGYDAGPADGVMGPQTVKAIRAFQNDYGLKPDGIAGPKTRSALNQFIHQKIQPVQ